VEFEAVHPVPVDEVSGHVLGEVDDLDGREGTDLDALTAADTEILVNDADLGGLLVHLDAEIALHVGGALLLTLQSTFLGLALILVDDGDSELGVFSDEFSLQHFG
jgi:hypothetical protein